MRGERPKSERRNRRNAVCFIERASEMEVDAKAEESAQRDK